ncbi:hypothetical protein JCM8202v2_001016 [Rhodotorula sphaerocarpa]
MSNAFSSVFDSITDQLPELPDVVPSLSSLAEAEEKDSKRIRPSRVGWWRDVLRYRGSTLGRIWRSCLGFSIWASLIAIVDLVYGRKIILTNNVTPLLSVVVGLLLVFRNGSAYNRWDDGRKEWARMIATSRTLARTAWIHIGAANPVQGPGRPRNLATELLPPLSAKARDDKRKAVRLVVAFLIATKHHVRREYGVKWPDLEPLLTANFKKLAATTGYGWGAAEVQRRQSQSASPEPSSPKRLKSKRSAASLLGEVERGRSSQYSAIGGVPSASGPESPKNDAGREGERQPLLSPPRQTRRKSILSAASEQEQEEILADYMAKPSLPLPLVIAHHLNLYFASCKRDGLIETIGPAGFNAFVQGVAQLTECFTTCERIATVGVPTVYGIHLKQCTSLFLATLPFVLVESMGFAMIPFVTLVAFTLCGIEGIATELEMPFGVDDSDLNLDLFCAEVHNEVEHMIARLPATVDRWDI